MQQRVLGKTGFSISAITLGGGGIGMVWGATTEDECISRPLSWNLQQTRAR